jgi:hypothetical protein
MKFKNSFARKQRGVSMALVLSFISAISIATVLYARVAGNQSTVQTIAKTQADVQIIKDSAEALRLLISSIQLRLGASVDYQVASGTVSSPTNQFTSFAAPPLGGSALTPLQLSPLIKFRYAGQTYGLATADVTDRVCVALNQSSIRPETPSISSIDESGATIFLVTNAGFNGGMLSDIFCVPGAGVGGQGRVFALI